ncbi:hypothetical protein B0O80DRAFT_530660 [Mortierella sp. GBAus27b]|nr:hypothetical protein B0O80DRAFT_530660 [Mortierella sp. GBAus27b]
MRDNADVAVTHSDLSITASPTFVSMPQRPTVVRPVGVGDTLPGDRPPTTIGTGPTGEPSTSSSVPNAPQAYEHKHFQSLTSPAAASSTRLIDDRLFVYRRLWEHNDASHSTCVEPTRGWKAGGDSGAGAIDMTEASDLPSLAINGDESLIVGASVFKATYSDAADCYQGACHEV